MHNGLTLWNYFDDYLIEAGVRTQDVPFPVFKILEGGLYKADVSLAKEISIISNSESGYINLHLSKVFMEKVEVQLYDSSGRIVKIDHIDPGQTEIRIKTDRSKSGLFLLTVKAGNRQFRKKIIML